MKACFAVLTGLAATLVVAIAPLVSADSRARESSDPIKETVSNQSTNVSTGVLQQEDSPGTHNNEIEIENAMLKIAESINIPAQRSGVLTELIVSEGQIVERGELIGRIDDQEAQLRVQQAMIALDIARREVADDIDVRYSRKSLEVAEADLRRGEEMRNSPFDLVSDAEYERLVLLVERHHLEIERAEIDTSVALLNQGAKENELQIRQYELSRHEILSPIDGMVVSLEKHGGEWTAESDTVVRIVRIDRLRVEGLVPAELAIGGLEGREVEISGIPGHEDLLVSGEVVFVNPEAITVGAKLRVWAEIDNTDMRLYPGLSCKMTIKEPSEETED